MPDEPDWLNGNLYSHLGYSEVFFFEIGIEV